MRTVVQFRLQTAHSTLIPIRFELTNPDGVSTFKLNMSGTSSTVPSLAAPGVPQG